MELLLKAELTMLCLFHSADSVIECSDFIAKQQQKLLFWFCFIIGPDEGAGFFSPKYD